MDDHVRYNNIAQAKSAAAAVQVGIVLFKIVDGQVAAGVQLGSVLHIGMHAACLVSFLCSGLQLFLHVLLLIIGQALNVFEQVADFIFFNIIINLTINRFQHAFHFLLMVESASIIIIKIADAAVHRYGQHVHLNCSCSHACAGYGSRKVTLCRCIHCEILFRRQGTVIHNGADRIIKSGNVYPRPDADCQRPRALPGRVLQLYLVKGVHRNIIRCQRTVTDAAGNPVTDIVHRDAACKAAAVQAACYACGSQGRFQHGFVSRCNGKVCVLISRLIGCFQFAVFHIGGYRSVCIHGANAQVYADCSIGCAGYPCAYIQVVDTVFVIGTDRCAFCEIYRGIGHRGEGRAVHLVHVHVIAGFYRSACTACHCSCHVKGGHGVFRVCGHSEVFGVNRIQVFF